MKLNHGLHLAYCTNVHRGETWTETFDSLKRDTLTVRERVCPTQPYAIGLRLSNQAARELKRSRNAARIPAVAGPKPLLCFTINGFPYGQFHADTHQGTGVFAGLDVPGKIGLHEVVNRSSLPDFTRGN